jgi:hypothetical protein
MSHPGWPPLFIVVVGTALQLHRFRFRIRTMMILVMISAVILTVWNLVPRAVDPLLSDRSGTVPALWVSRGVTRYIAVVALLTGIVASPLAIAIVLALKSARRDRTWQRQTVRWVGLAISLACGLAILDYPLDGMRWACLLRDGSGVAFYHQYRIWPGEHVTPCLELVTPTGKSRSYPIARNTQYQEAPGIRTDAEQTIVWFIDRPGARVRQGGVWCSINRTTGDFVGAGGPYPTGVSETSGFPPSR